MDWVPYQVDGEAGIGRQISIADIDGDKLPEIVVGGMKGAHVLFHRKSSVNEEAYRKAQPKLHQGNEVEATRGPALQLDPKTGRVLNAQEAEELKKVIASSGKTRVQDMQGFSKDRWSGGKQLFWSGAKPGDRLELEFTTVDSGAVTILAAFTMAADYGVVRFELDGKAFGKPVDLFNYPDVISSGELTLGTAQLDAGVHKLAIIIAGANPAAAPSHMVGLDYLRLQPSSAKGK